MTEKMCYDVVVIGSGPGGYVAAIKSAQAGKKVALIEKHLLGGTCLNVGCIPTKTLIAGVEALHVVKQAEKLGITIGEISVRYDKMKERKDGVITKIRQSLEGLIKSNKITIFKGLATFTDAFEIKVKGEDNLYIKGEKFILATGSTPVDIAAFPCDHTHIFNSTSILEMTTLPESMAIIGGGYIGCEFASLYAELGVKVTILESLPSLVTSLGKDISQTLTQAFKKKGIEMKTGVTVSHLEKTASGVTVHIQGQDPISVGIVLVATGRNVNTGGLGLEMAGVKTSERGAILVNDKMETSVPGIYAIGDVTGKVMLAHVASHQGIVAATNAVGGDAYMHYEAVPAVIFTHPEIATVGMTLEEAAQKGYSPQLGKFPFQALGKSIATLETEGFAAVVIDQKTGQILGAQVVGHNASSLIAEMALAISNELTIECVTETIHAHPTLPEAWLESGLIAQNTPIHFPPKILK
ncbi:dihydrolipoyl dehydrogenase [Rhabdochlamydiaceae symbiont of Dictyostelium giganteum]|uniref:dihydrolipoyl dehydrogenase n=1 Tax=Rhabdochlamydiaceae symbiont of Dictyostelium giganteum TaxID=3342349 RepID=UPI00384F967F